MVTGKWPAVTLRHGFDLQHYLAHLVHVPRPAWARMVDWRHQPGIDAGEHAERQRVCSLDLVLCLLRQFVPQVDQLLAPVDHGRTRAKRATPPTAADLTPSPLL